MPSPGGGDLAGGPGRRSPASWAGTPSGWMKRGVVKAAVETVAENTSDGVTAPLLFLALGGCPWGWSIRR